MKNKSPLFIEKICFYPYTADEKKKVRKNLSKLPFNRRHDFIYSPDMEGMAVCIEFLNWHFYSERSRGVRHKIRLTLVDATLRAEVASHDMCIYIPAEEFTRFSYVDFPLASIDIQPGHSYKLVAYDLTKSLLLGMDVCHLLDVRLLGESSGWYSVYSAGIRPAWETQLYRSLPASGDKRYFVRFDLRHSFGYRPPVILPEVEMRLYYPDGRRTDIGFMEPICRDLVGESYFVEQLFIPDDRYRGAFYAELRCMGLPIAGFVFSTSSAAVSGAWCDDAIEPLPDYSPDAARKRLNALLPQSTEHSSLLADDDEFTAAIRSFIDSELNSR